MITQQTGPQSRSGIAQTARTSDVGAVATFQRGEP